jgi:hypothetical protein
VLVAGCTTVTYSGPRRPREQVATISTKGTSIIEIDGTLQQVTNGTFEMLPGRHSLLVHLSSSTPDGPYRVVYFHSKYPLRVCFVARPGHEYLAAIDYQGNGRWEPRIFDQATLFWVTVRFPKPGQDDCLIL